MSKHYMSGCVIPTPKLKVEPVTFTRHAMIYNWHTARLVHVGKATQVSSIVTFPEAGGSSFQSGVIDKSVAPSDLLRAGDLHALSPLQRCDKLGRFEQAVGGAGVEPRKPASHDFDLQLTLFQIHPVHICNLKFTPVRWPNVRCDINNLLIVEIKARYRPMRLWQLGFFFDARRAHRFIERDHAIALGVSDLVGEHRRSMMPLSRLKHQFRQSMTEKDIIAEHEAGRTAGDE